MTDTEAVRRLFDELASEYDQHVPFFGAFGCGLVTWGGLQPGQRVLDIAAGRGALAGPQASRRGHRAKRTFLPPGQGWARLPGQA